MKKQFAIIGMGRFGISIGSELEALGHQVLAIEKSEAKVDALSSQFTHCVQADCTDENSIRALGLRNFDVVVVSVGDIQDSVMITLYLKEMGVPYVFAKANSDIHAKLLYKIGADKVVFPERDMGTRLAHGIASSNIFEVIELSKDYTMVEIGVIKAWEGKSLREMDFRKHWGINIVAIRDADGNMALTPGPDEPMRRGDTLIVVGKANEIARLERELQE